MQNTSSIRQQIIDTCRNMNAAGLIGGLESLSSLKTLTPCPI